MDFRIVRVPFADNLLDEVARGLAPWLGADAGDPDEALVLLPSSRVGRDLAHVLLEQNPRPALLLPRILTESQWADPIAAELGLGADDLPDDRFRAQMLAPRLAEVDWPLGTGEPGPGLASDFVAFFDEVRTHRLEDRLLDAPDMEPLLQTLPPAEVETARSDLLRVRAVWSLYRSAVPRDACDMLSAVADRLADGWRPGGARPRLVIVAGFGRIDPVRARILRAALEHGRDHRLYLPEAASPLDHRLLATWNPADEPTDPLAPTRRLLQTLGAEDHDLAVPEASTAGVAAPPLGVRLATLPDVMDAGGGPELVVAETPEDEARLITEKISVWLEEHGPPPRGITVATADPDLAERVTARLRDAGLDADNTVGRPLATWPAGLLLRFLLRTALTGLRAESLLEVLTHPYTDLRGPGETPGVWALRLERMFRREAAPQSGLVGLLRKARDHDAAATALLKRQTEGMRSYIQSIGDVFAPLLDLADGRAHAWADLLAAVQETWRRAAPERPLAEDRERPDLGAVSKLLQDLRRDAERLPVTTLVRFAADLGRVLASERVASKRSQGIPVTVTGLVEARLSTADLLLIAGLNEGVFPKPGQTPAVLPGPLRSRLGLPTWREARARDAELFQRLLHGADRVVLSWSRRRDGQPALVSSFAQRVQLALDLPDPPVAVPVDRRRAAVPLAAITADQQIFAGEPAAVPRHAPARPLQELSWSALRVWRDCPYRSLLERGYGLRPTDEVCEEFGAKEYGSVVHDILCAALAPDHPVYAALAGGSPEDALSGLASLAQERFLPGAADLPERKSRLHVFMELARGFVAHEVTHFEEWRPVAREVGFRLALPELAAWAEARAPDLDLEPVAPLPAHARAVVLNGVVDRIDQSAAGIDALLVLDYKTGQPPTEKQISTLEDLQLVLYAVAVEMGVVDGVSGTVTHAAYHRLVPGQVGPVATRGEYPLARDADEPLPLLIEGVRALVDLAVRASDPGAAFPLLPRAAQGQQPGRLPCWWCDFRAVCRIEERDLGSAVAQQIDAVVGRKEEI